MNFSVRWVRSAVNDLTDLWLQATSAERAAITLATTQIDERLQIVPQIQGESRDANQRILLVPPLGVIFAVSPPDQVSPRAESLAVRETSFVVR